MVVVVADSVVVASVGVLPACVGKLGCRGTVDIPRLMIVSALVSGAKVGASMPN